MVHFSQATEEELRASYLPESFVNGELERRMAPVHIVRWEDSTLLGLCGETPHIGAPHVSINDTPIDTRGVTCAQCALILAQAPTVIVSLLPEGWPETAQDRAESAREKVKRAIAQGHYSLVSIEKATGLTRPTVIKYRRELQNGK